MSASQRPSKKEWKKLHEVGASVEGRPQQTDRRLFCQIQVFTGSRSPKNLVEALEASGLEGVLYYDLSDPLGVGLLLMAEDPALMVGEARSTLAAEPFVSLVRRPELSMIGRTYSTGREEDLEDWLLARPRRYTLNPDWPWAVWYPIRRKPEFALLSREDQGKILYEHAMLGKPYAEGGHAFDVRLACYGLDQNDNDFLLGLVGPELHPLSRLVEDMRKTQQTAKYVESLGPFFVGKACWQSPIKA
jgi:chlorite dismutase